MLFKILHPADILSENNHISKTSSDCIEPGEVFILVFHEEKFSNYFSPAASFHQRTF